MIKRWKFCICALLALLMALPCGALAQTSPVAGKRVAYVMQMASSEIFEVWSDEARRTAEALGMEYEAFFCDGSDAAWRETVARCAAEGYDGLLLSHGGQDYAYSFLRDLLEQYPQLRIVAFDTLFLDASGQACKLKGVTQFFQQDASLAQMLLAYICEELYPDKVASGEPVNILKVWAGPGLLAAFDRREQGYAVYEDAGLIRTVETIAPEDVSSAQAQASMTEVAAEALARLDRDEIDAIWCCYDLYARGVYQALIEGGYDIPLVSADICDADLQLMAQEDSPWVACATTNWKNNGAFGMRVLALELTGEYEQIVDPASGVASDWLELPAYVIAAEALGSLEASVTTLEEIAGEAYADRSWLPASDWMAQILDVE